MLLPGRLAQPVSQAQTLHESVNNLRAVAVAAPAVYIAVPLEKQGS